MILVLLAIGCGGATAKGDPVAGEAAYTSSCVACHGADGDLGVEVGGVAASDLQDEVPDSSDEELTDVIQNGEGTMPAQTLDDTETADCIAYMREQWG